MNARIARALALFLLTALVLRAEVPQLINYQGRVSVGTANFDGSGQFKFALVNGAGTTTFWSNDGTSTAGSQPTAAVTLLVSKGLYTVLLGDASLTNMTAIPNAVFGNTDVRLRVWFNDGTNGSQVLTPDQRIAAVGYALMAGNVPDGAITTSKLPPSARLSHTAVWAGNVMVVWGGDLTPQYTATGGRYNPLTNTWVETTESGAPLRRIRHTAVSTGTEMIIWGGIEGPVLSTGGRYNPVTDVWAATSTSNAPPPRLDHSAVWTGTEMIIWGGAGASYFNDTWSYTPGKVMFLYQKP